MIEIRAQAVVGVGIDLKGPKEIVLEDGYILSLQWMGLPGCKHLSKLVKHSLKIYVFYSPCIYLIET